MAEYRSSRERNGGHPYETNEPKAIAQVLRKEGNVGGMSGTGQAFPHRGYIETDGQAMLRSVRNTIGDPLGLAEPEIDGTYQTGGRHLDRARRVALRKQRLGGSIASKMRSGVGPPPMPGAPVHRP